MFRSRGDVAELIHRDLAELPTSYLAFGLDASWFVVGPTGLFVVADGTMDGPATATRTVQRAVDLRSQLANELHWVPFIDAIVIRDTSDSSDVTTSQCAVVPQAMLRAALCDGPTIIDEDSLARIAIFGLRRWDATRDSIGGWST